MRCLPMRRLRNNDHLVDKLSFEDTAFTLTSSYNIQQTTTTNMVFGSRLSLSAMLALGLCLSQGTATEAAGITQLFNHAVRRFGEKAVENGVPAGVRVGANLAHIPTVPAGNRKLLGIGDAAPIAIHLPFHKPDDFIGEFQTAAGEIVPHYEPNGNAADITLLTEIEDAPDAKHRVAMGTNPMHSMEFSPQTITIKSGETVTWINMDGLPHDVVFTKVPDGVNTDDIDQTDTIDQDDSFSSTFTTPGEYYYHSDQGVDVTGKVVVKA